MGLATAFQQRSGRLYSEDGETTVNTCTSSVETNMPATAGKLGPSI